MNKLADALFDELVCMNEGYKDRLPCICEDQADKMAHHWNCPKCGYKEPNYQAMFEAEEREALEKRIMAAEAYWDAKKEEKMFRRLPGDHDGWPSNDQLEYFKRGGR